jgi:uncharacterized protein (DUF2235 family)
MPKIIAIFTDGTGNAARSLFKTNVWRLYQALDLTPVTAEQVQAGLSHQVAYYQDGIGTSTFKPLAIIGGAFGFGLKRNVIDAYIHLCETYQSGDQIYLFGFSRGGFTARVLLGLICSQGLLPFRHKVELHRYAPDAYRRYRRGFKRTGMLAPFLRNIRDWIIALWRSTFNQPHYRSVKRSNIRTSVKFIGVWDTVSAYGLPIAELTRGIDHWVWPLSLPHGRLPLDVDKARHALALDDEREAFHPLLWNEFDTKEPDRLLQVWFSGMHADVGGGYPHDGLALFPLTWMMREASSTGLRFRCGVLNETEKLLSHSVPMHDSRSFLGAYYRYQPRRISAYVQNPDVDTLAMRGPLHGVKGSLREVKIHQSVLERIRSGLDGYAPIALPKDFVTVDHQGQKVDEKLQNEPLLDGQKAVWDLVWWRRVTYFASLLVTLSLIVYPFLAEIDEACEYPQCALVPAVGGLANLLPAALKSWSQGFSSAPGTLFILIIILASLLLWGRHLQRRIHDTMRDTWDLALSIDKSSSAVGSFAAEKKPIRQLAAKIRNDVLAESSRLHRSEQYQKLFRFIRWDVLPFVFGLGLLGGSLALIVLVGLLIGFRFQIGYGDAAGAFCQEDSDPSFMAGSTLIARNFETSSPCWPTGVLVQQGTQYRVIFEVLEFWDPLGVERRRVGWFQNLQGTLRRRSITARLFQPLVRISSLGRGEIQALDVEQIAERRFVGTFSANRDGELFLFVNDTVISSQGVTTNYYRGNSGTAKIIIEALILGKQP